MYANFRQLAFLFRYEKGNRRVRSGSVHDAGCILDFRNVSRGSVKSRRLAEIKRCGESESDKCRQEAFVGLIHTYYSVSKEVPVEIGISQLSGRLIRGVEHW